MSDRVCPGWAPSGQKVTACGKPAGTPWTPIWCAEHDEQRREHIGSNLRQMLADLEAENAGPVHEEGER